MKPTPSEIALIAATLANGKNPVDFISKARELCEACEDKPEQQKSPSQSRHWEFDRVLDVLAPRDTPAMAKRLFHQFLYQEIKAVRDLTGGASESELERITRENEEVYKREGVQEGEAQNWIAKFPAWRKAKNSAGRAKGGLAKSSMQKAKKRRKEIEKAANSKATEKKKRLVFLPPSDLDWMRTNNLQE